MAYVRKTWKEYFEDINNVVTNECVAVNMRCVIVARRDKYFGEKTVKMIEVE